MKINMKIVLLIALAFLLIVAAVLIEININRSINEESADNIVKQTSDLYSAGKKDESVNILEKYHNDHLNENAISYQLARFYFQTKKFDNFISLVQSTNLESPTISNMLAQVNLEKGEVDKAIEIYQKMMAQYPNSLKIYINLASIYQSKSDFEKALSVINQGLKGNPNSVVLILSQSSLYLKMGQKNEALKSAERVLEIEKDNIQAKSIIAGLK